MPNSNDSITLKCSACGHANEPERVYCHNCGEKLDRSLLLKPVEKKERKNPDARRKKVQQMMNPGQVSARLALIKAAQLLSLAAVVAALYLALQKPHGAPPEKIDTLPERDFGDLWSRMMEAKPAITQPFTEFEINYYLSRILKPADGAIPGIQFKRAYIKIHPGEVTIAAERDMWGLTTTSSITYRPVLKEGVITFETIGIHIGRLGLHPMLKSVGEMSLSGVRSALERDLANLGRLADLQTGEGMLVVITKAQP